MQYLTDEELVSRYLETCQNDYFEVLYERYCNRVRRTCLSFTKDTMQAEDLTQDIFIRLIAKLRGYKKQAKFSTWLYSITRNYCTDQIKSSRHQQEVNTENWDGLLVATDDSSEGEEAMDQAIQLAMSKLSADEQKLLCQKYQGEMTIKDLAAYYSLTESAVKMRLKRSRERLLGIYQQLAVY